MSDAVAPPLPVRRWRDELADVLRGASVDATHGPIPRTLALLAVPMVLEMAMESLFAVVDIFFVARLGADAVAAVGSTEAVLSLVYAVAFGLAIAVSATVARRIGERRPDAAARAAGQGVVLGLAVSAVLAVVGVAFAPQILALLGNGEAVQRVGAGYTRAVLGGSGSVLLLFLLNAVFRGAGDATVAMRVLWVANGVNIALDPCLIFGLGPFPELGVTGAGVATVIGRSTGVLLALRVLVRGHGRVHLDASALRPDRAVLASLARLASTGALQTLIGTASWIGLVRVLSGFGSAAVAGYTIGIRIVIFAILPAWGVASAAATMLGQSLGARDPARAERAVWLACRANAAFLTAVGLALVLGAPWLVRLFGDDPAVAPFAEACLRLVGLGFPAYAFGMVLTQAFNGAGDTWTPTWINLACFWFWEIPLAWALAYPLGQGPRGAFLAIAIAFSTLALVSAALFRRGRWRTTRV